MKKILLLALIVACFSGCTSKPVTTTTENRANSSRAIAYDNFVKQRTQELQRMGGPFKKEGAASMKAQSEADSYFGGRPADVSTTWSWGKNADKAQVQDKFNGALDDMAKSKAAQ